MIHIGRYAPDSVIDQSTVSIYWLTSKRACTEYTQCKAIGVVVEYAHSVHTSFMARFLFIVVSVSEVLYICMARLWFTYCCVHHVLCVMFFEPFDFHVCRVTIWTSSPIAEQVDAVTPRTVRHAHFFTVMHAVVL